MSELLTPVDEWRTGAAAEWRTLTVSNIGHEIEVHLRSGRVCRGIQMQRVEDQGSNEWLLVIQGFPCRAFRERDVEYVDVFLRRRYTVAAKPQLVEKSA